MILDSILIHKIQENSKPKTCTVALEWAQVHASKTHAVCLTTCKHMYAYDMFVYCNAGTAQFFPHTHTLKILPNTRFTLASLVVLRKIFLEHPMVAHQTLDV